MEEVVKPKDDLLDDLLEKEQEYNFILQKTKEKTAEMMDRMDKTYSLRCSWPPGIPD